MLEVEPEESWGRKEGRFTAGEVPEVDLEIRAWCNGYQGVSVADQEGWMRVEVQGVSMIRDDGEGHDDEDLVKGGMAMMW